MTIFLTKFGEMLRPVIESMEQWGSNYNQKMTSPIAANND